MFTFKELHFFEQMWMPTIPPGEIELETAIQFTTRLMAIQKEGYYARPDLSKYQGEARELMTSKPGKWTAPEIFASFVKYEANRCGKTIACDQTPRNVFYIKELLTFYPNAHVVHIIRDPRDVLLSQKNRWRRRNFGNKKLPIKESIRYWVNYHPISISMLWKSGIKAWERIKDHPRVHSLQFEDMIENPDAFTRELCGHIGIKYSPTMLEVPQVGSSHGTDHPERLGINKEVAGRWQRANKTEFVDLHICQKITKKYIVEFNYPVEKFRLNPFYYLWTLTLWPIKAGMAVLANLDKSTNIFAFIARRLR